MRRCLQLAKLAMGNVAPNPMVGAVLVHEGRIIGEGYHTIFGGAHAEVECFNSVVEQDKMHITNSILYVSLEPCAHFGKTPPCVNLIIENKVPNVVIGCTDPFPSVAGKGIQKLQAAGINVITDVLKDECREINKRFFTFHESQRPFIILKWAQTLNGKIGSESKARLKISNGFTDRIVHSWRSEEEAILVGTNTAMADDPQLTTRLVPGKNPIRIAIDRQLKLPLHLHLFDGSVPTIIFNTLWLEQRENISYIKINGEQNFLQQLLKSLHDFKIQSVLVEGGATLIESFINEGLWDEARVITNNTMHITEGLSAPSLSKAQLVSSKNIGSDSIRYYKQ